MADTPDLNNDGIIVRPGATPSKGPEKTLLVSGVGRGGTSLVASVLFHAGVFMGEHLAEAVFEDQELVGAFNGGHRDVLTRLIASRNAAHRIWGFKYPGIHVALEYRDVSLFRNPHLVVIFRDPVAVAARTAIAEYRKPLVTMRESLDALRNILGFVENTTAPALLLSYEKALLKPRAFIDALAEFCGLPLNEAARQTLLRAVQPEAREYVERARRQYGGVVEFIVDNVLYGWCYEAGTLDPVDLELFAGSTRLLGFPAAEFRQDLLSAQFGNGNHGFAVDLRQFHLNPDQRLEVRVAGREFVVPGSGKMLREYYRT